LANISLVDGDSGDINDFGNAFLGRKEESAFGKGIHVDRMYVGPTLVSSEN